MFFIKYIHFSPKYVHLFSQANQDPFRPYLSLSIYLGSLGIDLRPFHTSKYNFEPFVHLKKKIDTFLKKMCIFYKNIYIFQTNQGPIRPYLDLNIHFRNLENGLELFPHREIGFGTSHLFLRKICTFFIKMYIHSSYFLEVNWDPLGSIMSHFFGEHRDPLSLMS